LDLLNNGIVGISHVPNFQESCQNYINAARAFSLLPENIKQQYAPDRDAGVTQGYELGAEKFKDDQGNWQIDNKKASYYAFVPDNQMNVWPKETDLQTHYLALGQLIFETGKLLHQAIGLNHENLCGNGRMLHYQKNLASTSNWCGAHYDHGLLTGLIPAYYFMDGQEIEEPNNAGLYVLPTNSEDYFKVDASDKSILFFQVGEFAQLISNDRIKSTKHFVKNANEPIERLTFALFFNPNEDMIIKTQSQLIKDERYINNQFVDGSISYKKWADASYARYRVI
jgi:isopenicillin N synthase-like dioxygenase